VVIIFWVGAVLSLGKQFNALAATKPEPTPEPGAEPGTEAEPEEAVELV